MECILSVDVEDWFHILDVPSAPPLAEWHVLPSRVESNFFRLLELFAEHNVKSTCFFLGWIAERFPHLVKAAVRQGHEIGSHGFSHQLIYNMTPREFLDDALRAKTILEDTSGCRVLGYRAPGFSVTEKTPWFFTQLIDVGHTYDSSVFPAPRIHGGMQSGSATPYRIVTPYGGLVELPMTTATALGRRMCFFGGGYLRLFPLPVIRRMVSQVLRESRPVIFYVHPREIDPRHPHLAMTLARRFRCYVSLRRTEDKLRHLLSEFDCITCGDFVSRYFGDTHSSEVSETLPSSISA